ncbi:MAG: rubredoxin [Gammaproteobacteria bacterium]|nr:rubredoxin [Gammaproteobacteria bacterium]
MNTWQCIVCGWIYDEEKGCAEEGVPCGTAWADVVDGFLCPDCGVGKHEFATIEIDRSE